MHSFTGVVSGLYLRSVHFGTDQVRYDVEEVVVHGSSWEVVVHVATVLEVVVLAMVVEVVVHGRGGSSRVPCCTCVSVWYLAIPGCRGTLVVAV